MKKVVIILALMLTSAMTFAQETVKDTTAVEESEPKFTAAVDIVYPYLWRGIKLIGNKVAFQPYASYAITDKLTAGVWGTTNFSDASDAYNEFDWYVSYQVTPIVKVMVSDYYYWNSDIKSNYWNYDDGTQAIDLSVLLDFSDKGVPVDFQWNTLIAGNDFNNDGDRNFSSYAEVGYSHSLESVGIDLRAFAGAVVNESSYYVTDGFSFTNVGLNIAKEIKFSEKFSVPVFVRYTYNDTGWVNNDGDLKNNFISGGLTLTIK